MSFIAAAVIGAGASLIGGSMAAGAAKDAAAMQARSSGKALAFERQQYEEGVARQKPFYEAGVNALGQYQTGIQPGGELTRGFTMADYQEDPGYGFRMKEGTRALDQSAAARGGLLSGNALRGAQQYGQQLGSQEYQNAYNRFVGEQGTQRNALANLAGIGQTAVGSMNQAGAAYGQSGSGIMQQQGLNAANAGLYGAGARASSYGQAANQLQRVNWGNPNAPYVNTYGASSGYAPTAGSFSYDPSAGQI
jgi:hypothetical protein